MTRDEIRAKAKSDGLFLATKVLGYDGFCEDVHGELFDYTLDPEKPFFEQGIPKDELLLWPRGHYKSTARVVQVIQFILNFPDIRILLMQGTKKLSKGWLGEVKSHFLGEGKSRLTEFFPEFKLVKRGSVDEFTVPTRQRKHLKEPTCTISSGKSVKASQHYDLIVADDLVNDQNFQNKDVVAKVTEDFHHCQSLLDPGGFRRVSGTRYTFGDLYEQIIRSNTQGGKWVISVKTCWADEPNRIPLFPERKLANGTTIGFSADLLDKIRADQGESTFSSQYLNKPIAAASHYFPAALMATRVKPVPVGLSAPVVFIDLASSRRIESDHRIILTGRMDSLGGMYVTDLAGGHYPPGELAKKIIAVCLEQRPLKVLIEKTAPAVYLAELVRIMAQEYGIVIPIDFIEVTNNKDAKYLRIAAVAGYIQRLWFAPGLENWDRLVEEFDHFPKGSHDDYPDTVGLMVAWFTKNMPLMRPDPLQSAYSKSPYTAPNELYTQVPVVSSSEFSLGSDFL